MPRESAFRGPGDTKKQFRGDDRVIADLAERQHGVVARWQLLRCGIGSGAVKGRVGNGRLHRLHPGVYAVGHPIQTWEGRWMAAALAGGRGAVLSHRSAASLWRLMPTALGPVDIAVPRSTRSTGLVCRHTRHLPVDEKTIRHRIPVTTVSRTLFDLAAVLRPSALERALREAEVLRLPFRPPLPELLSRYPGARGTRPLRECLIRLGRLGVGVTRSKLEDRFLAFLSKHRLPLPETNVIVEIRRRRIEADCLWREQRVIAELDGHEAHGTRAAFEGDRERDRSLQAAGWRAIRVTWRQVEAGDVGLIADLRELLGSVRDNVRS
jgi:putative AbiEi antitoxin of type IV toxin-antitoxin system